MATATSMKPAYVRPATHEDYDKIIDSGVEAFIHDPVLLFFGGVRRFEGAGLGAKDTKGLRAFISMMLHSCASRGGRVTVVMMPQESGEETIVASTFWFPPNNLYNDGAIDMVKRWGLGGLSDRVTTHRRGEQRIEDQYLAPVHKVFEKSFKKRGVRIKPNNTWYLCMAFTHPDFQGKGCLSLLMREQFAFEPSATYTVEASREKTSMQYARFGFEAQETVTAGVGKVGADGLPAKGKDAVGVTAYPMVKWGEREKDNSRHGKK